MEDFLKEIHRGFSKGILRRSCNSFLGKTLENCGGISKGNYGKVYKGKISEGMPREMCQ